MTERGGTPKGERAARQILEATLETLAAHGTAGTSLQRIADAAGVDKRTPAYYFGDRDGLLRAATLHLGDRLLEALHEAHDATTDDVDLGIASWRVTVDTHPTLHRAHIELASAAVSSGHLRHELEAVRARLEHAVLGLAGGAAGQSRVAPEVLARLVVATLHGLAVDHFLRGDSSELRSCYAALVAWVASLVDQA